MYKPDGGRTEENALMIDCAFVNMHASQVFSF